MVLCWGTVRGVLVKYQTPRRAAASVCEGMVLTTTVVVFGSSQSPPGSAAWTQAERVGELVARHGLVLASGGYGGVMGAASRGARQAGGHVVGVTTRSFTDRVASGDLHENVEESDYMARMATLLRRGDLFVALPGGLGTLSEILAAWCLASIDQLGGDLVCFREPWEPIVRSIVELEEVSRRKAGRPRFVQEPDELLPQLERLVGR